MKINWTHRSFLGLELLLPLQAVLFNFSLGFFFGLLQPPVLSLAGLGHLLGGPFLRLEQLLDALRLTGHGYGDGAGGGDSEAADDGLLSRISPSGQLIQTRTICACARRPAHHHVTYMTPRQLTALGALRLGAGQEAGRRRESGVA